MEVVGQVAGVAEGEPKLFQVDPGVAAADWGCARDLGAKATVGQLVMRRIGEEVVTPVGPKVTQAWEGEGVLSALIGVHAAVPEQGDTHCTVRVEGMRVAEIGNQEVIVLAVYLPRAVEASADWRQCPSGV